MSEPLDPRRADDPAPLPPAPLPPAASPEAAVPQDEPAEPPTTLWSPPQAPAWPPPQQPPAAPSYQPTSYGAPPAPASGAPVVGPTTPFPAVDPYAESAYPAALPVPYPPAPASYPQQVYAQPMVMVGTAGTYGFDPVTGQALSPKSKVVAGLLQLLPGFLFALGGIGRLYAGNTTLGVIQIVASVVGWTMFWCGVFANVFVLFLPFLVYGAIWLWFVIDGIVMLAGRPVDDEGRLLRT